MIRKNIFNSEFNSNFSRNFSFLSSEFVFRADSRMLKKLLQSVSDRVFIVSVSIVLCECECEWECESECDCKCECESECEHAKKLWCST